jgi:nitroreductase
MKILDAILSRRSVRKYTSEHIPIESIIELTKYGMYAPSAHNRQPWHFVLLNDKATFLKIEGFHPYSKMLKNAQWGIVVCGDEQLANTPDYLPVDCAAATQNILLAAHGSGYGAVWLGIYPREERVQAMKELLELPPHIHAFSIISIGYPEDHKPSQQERFQKDRIHTHKWQK